MNSWEIFDDWGLEKKSVNNSNVLNWSDFDVLNKSFNTIIEAQYKELIPLIEQWDSLTIDLGKDATHKNWSNFRPLNLSREEDWSNWLAFLIEHSESGMFSYYLLNEKEGKNPKKVHRELSCGNYRADIVINWEGNNYTHIEVKIGDENLLKTFNTCLTLEDKFSNTNWKHYILLLSNQVNSWNQVSFFQSKHISLITWEDVSIALRKSILGEESITWKVWAYSFIGVIEQKLIGFNGHLLNDKPKENLEVKLNILKQGLKHE
ncbi:MAG: hypothetical protein ABL940_00320 [Bacteroidia bacterium]